MAATSSDCGDLAVEITEARLTRSGKGGGEGGIRTHGTLAGTTVFETAPIDHSGTSPQRSKQGR